MAGDPEERGGAGGRDAQVLAECPPRPHEGRTGVRAVLAHGGREQPRRGRRVGCVYERTPIEPSGRVEEDTEDFTVVQRAGVYPRERRARGRCRCRH